uniref:Uncharacterized protein n=1 Tax=Cacopsylla melanoneura TaxID=428564 RepID=A0A8D9AGS3_9HEMI
MLRISFFRSLGVLSACSLLGVILRISFFRSLGVLPACSLLGVLLRISFFSSVRVLSLKSLVASVSTGLVASRFCLSLLVLTDSGFITCELNPWEHHTHRYQCSSSSLVTAQA